MTSTPIMPSFSSTYPLLYKKLILWAAERLAGHQNWFLREHREALTLLEYEAKHLESLIRYGEKPTSLFRSITQQKEDKRELTENRRKLVLAQVERHRINEALKEDLGNRPTGVIGSEIYKQAKAEVDQYTDDICWRKKLDSFLHWNQKLSRPEKWHLRKIASVRYIDLISAWDYVQINKYQVITEPTSTIFLDKQGGYTGHITRNSYECDVLNAANLFFIDIDLKLPDCDRHESAGYSNYHEAIDAINDFSSRHKDLGFRSYMTAGGLRLIETTRQWYPWADDTHEVMEGLKADPLYAQLCKNQETFRARLTPKPWRTWQDELEYATTAYTGTIGKSHIAPELEYLIDLHDISSRANTPVTLA